MDRKLFIRGSSKKIARDWKMKILFPFYHGYGEDDEGAKKVGKKVAEYLEAKKERIRKLIERQDGEDFKIDDVEILIDNFKSVEGLEDFNGYMDELYDIADEYSIWIDTFSGKSANKKRSVKSINYFYRISQKPIDDIIVNIKSGKDPYFGYSHFDVSNMADYDIMQNTINDMVAVYDIEETQAADIVQALTHGESVGEIGKDVIEARREKAGYTERGKKDGTGPYKDSYQRKVLKKDEGKKKDSGNTCPFAKTSIMLSKHSQLNKDTFKTHNRDSKSIENDILNEIRGYILNAGMMEHFWEDRGEDLEGLFEELKRALKRERKGSKIVKATAESELFVTETVRDALVEKYAELKEIAFSIEVPKNWLDIWDERAYPSEGSAKVKGDKGTIGIVKWTVSFEIVVYSGGRAIEADIKDILFIPVN